MAIRATEGKKRVPRRVVGTGYAAYSGTSEELVDAVKEYVANCMTWMHMKGLPHTQCITKITINVGKTLDVCIDDSGPGIGTKQADYQTMFHQIGHEKDAEYERRQQDPEFIGMIGMGINSGCGVSKNKTVSFRSVSTNERGQKYNMIASIREEEDGTITADEEPDMPSEPVLEHEGLRVVIEQPIKPPHLKKLVEDLSEIFTRKFDGGEYPVVVVDDITKQSMRVPQSFPTNREVGIGRLSNGFDVRADLRPAKDEADSVVRVLVKNVKMAEMSTEFLAKDYVSVNSIAFTANRKGLKRDSMLYQELKDLTNRECERLGIRRKIKPKKVKPKNEKRIVELALKKLQNYYRKHRLDPLRLFSKGQAAQSNETRADMSQRLTEDPLPKKPTQQTERKHGKGIDHGCAEGFRWSKKQQKCVPKRRHRPRVQVDGGDDLNNPQLRVIPTPATLDRPLIYISQAQSAIIVNTDYAWSTVLESADDNTWNMALSWAIVDAMNPVVSKEDFQRLFWDTLNDGCVV